MDFNSLLLFSCFHVTLYSILSVHWLVGESVVGLMADVWLASLAFFASLPSLNCTGLILPHIWPSFLSSLNHLFSHPLWKAQVSLWVWVAPAQLTSGWPYSASRWLHSPWEAKANLWRPSLAFRRPQSTYGGPIQCFRATTSLLESSTSLWEPLIGPTQPLIGPKGPGRLWWTSARHKEAQASHLQISEKCLTASGRL